MTTVPNDFSIYQSFTWEGLRLFLFKCKSQIVLVIYPLTYLEQAHSCTK